LGLDRSFALLKFLLLSDLDFSLDFAKKVLPVLLEQWVAEDTFGVFLSGLVESVHVELSDE
jgi:hypothetical protein